MGPGNRDFFGPCEMASSFLDIRQGTMYIKGTAGFRRDPDLPNHFINIFEQLFWADSG
jgi:hypothetical protein